MLKAAVNDGIATCACLGEDFEAVTEEAAAEEEPVPTENEHKTGTLPGMMSEEEILEKENKEKEKEEKKKKHKSGGITDKVFKWGRKFKDGFTDGCDNVLNLLHESDNDNKEE